MAGLCREFSAERHFRVGIAAILAPTAGVFRRRASLFPEAERLRRYIIRYDTIRPAHPELPYGQGKEGFKAPAEWRVTKPLNPGSPQIAAGAGAFFGRTALPHSYPDDFPS